MQTICVASKHSHLAFLSSVAFSTVILSSSALASCRLKNVWTRRRALACPVSIGRFFRPQDAILTDEPSALQVSPDKGDAHVPVLLKEVVTQFEHRRLLSFVDCTLGAGGHAAAIISTHPEMETFIGMDVDPVAHAEAYPRLQGALSNRAGTDAELKLQVVRTNFRNIKTTINDLDPRLGSGGVDGILMDLGMSSMQVNEGNRGFSFLREGPADMRMDPTASLNAKEILNTWPEAEVGRILRDYGEERRWKYLARRIVEERLSGGITTTSQLVAVIGGSSYMRSRGKHGRLRMALHPATRTFQALRIAVNDELRSLELALSEAFNSLSPGGILQVISFHSLEDRIVKQFFLSAAGLQKSHSEDIEENESDLSSTQDYRHVPGETRYNKSIRKKALDCGTVPRRPKNVIDGRNAKILTKRPIVPSDEEMGLNYRSRSAKLRVIEKK